MAYQKAERRSMVFRRAMLVGPEEALAQSSTRLRDRNELLAEWELTHSLPIALFSIGAVWLAADPSPLRTVTPVSPLPGSLPTADILDIPLPLEPQWHVIGISTLPTAVALPPTDEAAADTSDERRAVLPPRSHLVRISIPSPVETVNIPPDRVRALPAMLGSLPQRGLPGFILDPWGSQRVATLIDLVAIAREVMASRV